AAAGAAIPAIPAIPPAPASMRAAVKPRRERMRGAVAAAPERDVPAPKASAAQSFRPLIATAVDWPIAKPSGAANDELAPAAAETSAPSLALAALEPTAAPPAPTFGLALADCRDSLPAFAPPASLRDALVAAPAPRSIEPSSPEIALVSDIEDPFASARAARKTKLVGFAIGVAMALAAVGLAAFAR
ncbi:MAG TPA: hypothetical protein VL400_18055, partial [Polyangiaceae bacterium]|nr:hypothetical protein [Polyangiaceae bacterium]